MLHLGIKWPMIFHQEREIVRCEKSGVVVVVDIVVAVVVVVKICSVHSLLYIANDYYLHPLEGERNPSEYFS